jgi:hypothetical protein
LANLDSLRLNTPLVFPYNGGIHGSTGVQGRIDSAGRGELESKDIAGHFALADETFEDRRRIVDAHGLKSHSHHAVAGVPVSVQIVNSSQLQIREDNVYVISFTVTGGLSVDVSRVWVKRTHQNGTQAHLHWLKAGLCIAPRILRLSLG